MKLSFAILCLLVISCSAVQQPSLPKSANKPYILEEETTALLTCARYFLRGGIPGAIPPLDPLNVESLPIDLDALGIEGATGFLNFKDFNVKGLMSWDLDLISIRTYNAGGIGIRVKITPAFSKIALETDYDADLTVSEINVWGNGKLTADITNLKVEFMVDIKLDGRVLNLQFLPSVEDIKVKFTGLFNDVEQTEQVNAILNSVLTPWVNEKAKDISDALAKIVYELLGIPVPFKFSMRASEVDDFMSCIDGIFPIVMSLLNTIIDDPLHAEKVSIINIPPLAQWTLNQFKFEDFLKIEIVKNLTSSIWDRPGVGEGVLAETVLHWPQITLDIAQTGLIDILGFKLEAVNSKVYLLVQDLKLEIRCFIMPDKFQLTIIPRIEENRIASIFTGIKLNNNDISSDLTNFVSKDLAAVLIKYPDEIGEIIGALIVILLTPPKTPGEEYDISHNLEKFIEQFIQHHP